MLKIFYMPHTQLDNHLEFFKQGLTIWCGKGHEDAYQNAAKECPMVCQSS